MTILGNHTIAEVDDLIAAKDPDIADFATRRATLPFAPDSNWDQDFAALQSRYSSAKTAYQAERAVAVAGNLLTPNSFIAAEDSYQALLGALYNAPPPAQGVTPSYTDTTLPGGFQDLANRMLHMATPGGVSVTVDESNVVQPTAQDVDLDVYNAIGKMPIVGKKPVPWWMWAAGGMVLVGVFGTVVVPFVAPVLMAKRMV